MKYFFTGHISLDNRGSEAILRGLIRIIKKFDTSSIFIIPSMNPTRDSETWKNDPLVSFVPARIPINIRVWSQFTKFHYFQRLIILLSPQLDKVYKDHIMSADVVLSIGGDMYTNGGKFPLWIYQADQYALRCKKPTFLIGATVSSFEINSHKTLLKEHFSRFNMLLVREDDSYHRLKNEYDLNNVVKASDSAFWMAPVEVEKYRYFFQERDHSRQIVGVNISPLLERLGGVINVKSAIKEFIRNNPELDFILIPHVFLPKNNDLEYLLKYKNEHLSSLSNVYIVEDVLSAPELKFIISNCDFLIAARTHATIAAFSTGVPTICLAYSEKAFGLARRIYGNEKFSLRFDAATFVLLTNKFSEMKKDQIVLKELISKSAHLERELALVIYQELIGSLK